MISIDSCFTFGHYGGHNRQVPCLDTFNSGNQLTFWFLFKLGSKSEFLVLRSCWVKLKAVINQSGCWEGFYSYRHDHTRVERHLRSDSVPLPSMYLGRAWRQTVYSYRFISMRVLPYPWCTLKSRSSPSSWTTRSSSLTGQRSRPHSFDQFQEKGGSFICSWEIQIWVCFVQHIIVLQAIQILQKDSCFDTNMRLHQKVII